MDEEEDCLCIELVWDGVCVGGQLFVQCMLFMEVLVIMVGVDVDEQMFDVIDVCCEGVMDVVMGGKVLKVDCCVIGVQGGQMVWKRYIYIICLYSKFIWF